MSLAFLKKLFGRTANANTSASENYKARIEAFESVLNDCINVSNNCAGIPAPTGAHFYASVLFTALCSRGVSFAILAPGTSWSKKIVDHWDYASLAVLVRSLLEIRLAFFYLCVEQCDRTEWDCRWNIFNLHDCMARIHLFSEMDSNSADIPGFQTQAEELKGRLNNNAFFLALSGSDQRKLLHGKNAYLSPLETIAKAAGVEIQHFRWLYKFLSSHVHGLPLSFYRAGQFDGRGRGVHCEVEDNYSCLCVSFALTLLVAARDEMEALFAPHVER
jgi:hypothetical protein